MTPINDTGETITDEDGLCPCLSCARKNIGLKKEVYKTKGNVKMKT